MWWGCLLLILLKLWLTGAHELLAKFRAYDDSLFLELAQHILNGNWLGELNYRTLIKGPGFPLFIALCYWLGIPLLLAQQLLYTIACLALMLVLRHWIKGVLTLLLFFALLLFNPFSYLYPLVGALMRESIYNSFALLFFAALLGIWQQAGEVSGRALRWSLLAGLAFAALWITREETIWTVPGYILFGFFFLPAWRWNGGSGIGYRIILYILPVAISAGAFFAVAKTNQHYYGALVYNELKSKQFASALGSLMNIREDDYHPGIIVGPRAQKRAFEVSPTFASLEEHIKRRRKNRPNVFYIWTLRSAVNDGGYYADVNNVQPALDVYANIGAEITAACESGELRCFDRAPTLRPPLYPEHIEQFPGTFLELIWNSIGFVGHNAESSEFDSKADMGMLMTFDHVTGHSAVRKSVYLESMRPEFSRRMVAFKESTMQHIGTAYRYLAPGLFAVALVLHLVGLVQLIKGYRDDPLPLFGLIVGGSLLAIVFILTYVKVTLWDVVRPITVVYPLLLLYITTMIANLYTRKKGVASR